MLNLLYWHEGEPIGAGRYGAIDRFDSWFAKIFNGNWGRLERLGFFRRSKALYHCLVAWAERPITTISLVVNGEVVAFEASTLIKLRLRNHRTTI